MKDTKSRRIMISVGNSRFDLGIKDLAILSDATKVGNINKTRAIKRIKKKDAGCSVRYLENTR